MYISTPQMLQMWTDFSVYKWSWNQKIELEFKIFQAEGHLGHSVNWHMAANPEWLGNHVKKTYLPEVDEQGF